MAVHVEWEFLMGGYDPLQLKTSTAGIPNSSVDFTSRTRSISVAASIEVGQVGSSSASITLDNSDGAFTPGGGGAYDDWDFFANPVFVRAKIGTNPASLAPQRALFAGVVSDVEYFDDGKSSTVTIQADDTYTLIARNVLTLEFDNIGLAEPLTEIVSSLLNKGVPLPKFGARSTFYFPFSVALPRYFQTIGGGGFPTGWVPVGENLELIAEEGEYVGDVIARLAVGEHGIVLPLTMEFEPDPELQNQGSIRYQHAMIARDWLWTGGSPIVFEPDSLANPEFKFVETTPTGEEIPFVNPSVGFGIDHLITQATATVTGGVPQVEVGATSTTKYGPRAVEFSELPMGFDEDAQRLAEHLVTRYDTVTYHVTSVTVTGGMITNLCADTALPRIKELVTATTVGEYSPEGNDNIRRLVGTLFHPAYIEFTGAGGVPLNSRVTFMEVSYDIQPDDWSIKLSGGRDAVNSYGFVIGLDDYGVLGTNKLA